MAVIKWLASPADYLSVWRDMQDYTNLRGADTPDEIWLCEHAPVTRWGRRARPGMCSIPPASPSCIATGAGRSRITARARSWPMRCSTCGASTCTSRNTSRCSRARSSTRWPRPAWRAPQARRAGRVCAGSRWRRRAGQDRRAGHQDPQRPRLSRVSLNVDMDLAPFLGINPCGYAGLRTVDMAACGVRRELADVGEALARNLVAAWRRARPGGRRRTRL